MADRGRRLEGEPSERGGGQRGGGRLASIASVGVGAAASGTGGGRDGAADRGRCGVASGMRFGDLADCGRRRCGDLGVGALRVGDSFLAPAGRRTRRRRPKKSSITSLPSFRPRSASASRGESGSWRSARRQVFVARFSGV